MAKRFLLLFGCLVLSTCSSSALFLANTLAALDDYEVERDIRFGDSHIEQLDIYMPDEASARPVIVFFYGGCWGACIDYTRPSYEFVAQAFTAQGYVVVVPDYPLYPAASYEQIMQSAARAATWVEDNIGEYGGDSSNILLSGHSAGAHMAAMLMLDEQWLPAGSAANATGFIGFAGPYDFLPFTDSYQHRLFGPEERYPASQPINFVDGNEPPMLLLHGNDDVKVKPKNSRNLAAKLRRYQRDVDAVFYEGMNHVELLAAISRPFRDSEPVMHDIQQFLDRVAPVIKPVTGS